jgi:hypothetical protein
MLKHSHPYFSQAIRMPKYDCHKLLLFNVNIKNIQNYDCILKSTTVFFKKGVAVRIGSYRYARLLSISSVSDRPPSIGRSEGMHHQWKQVAKVE